ncbi:hypothetical protein [Alicyclobacillus vulcanalis]|uniref:Uncharacterized protein n=1 Tax=Alicyclobacillus vulcanalis TaxID=252246 RepID=A0A1N7LZJ6_9BACL|nr:hypothetical protein [Alicyclobacillus vulcanalis]SIS79244.1 hypothetical protein SAMN05421799_104104 [Alicyclobacillus vulcanalis]
MQRPIRVIWIQDAKENPEALDAQLARLWSKTWVKLAASTAATRPDLSPGDGS